MAGFKYFLKDKKSEDETPIRLHVNFPVKQTVKVYTGEKINPDFWNFDEERPKNTKKNPFAATQRTRLDNILAKARNEFTNYLNNNDGNYPTKDELKDLIEIAIGKKNREENIDFFTYFKRVIENEKIRLEIKNKKDEHGTIYQSYKRTYDLLVEFQKEKKYKIDFGTVDMNFYSKFVDFLRDKGLSVNTQGKHIKYVKVVMNYALGEGKHSNLLYKHPKFKILTEKNEAIALNENELEIIEKFDLSQKPHLIKVRDLFLIGAWTGLRFSDFSDLKFDNIKDGNVEVITKKTAKPVTIPVLTPLQRVLNKYQNDLPKSLTNQGMNRSLKEIGKLIFEDKDIKIIDKAKERFKFITTHVARRSFATNMYYRDIPINTIMAITGHTTESEFLGYIRVNPNEHAKIMSKKFNESKSHLSIAN